MKWAATFAACAVLLIALSVRAQQDPEEQQLQDLQNSVAKSHAREDRDWNNEKTKLPLDMTGSMGGNAQAATAGGANGMYLGGQSTTKNVDVSMCTATRAPTYNACAGNSLSQAPCYQAAAWVCQCYLNADPTNAHASDWRQCVAQNNASAASLSSHAYTVGR